MTRFLLAKLHLDSLFDIKLPKDVKIALEKLPKGSEAYDHAYQDAMHRIHCQGPKSVEFANHIMSWITCAKRPLSTSELQHALAVEVGKMELDEKGLPEVEDMVSVCAGLVTIDEESNVIRLVHYTTQEFLERMQKHWFPNAETNITRICVSYLSFHSFECGPCQTYNEFEKRLQSNKLYHYSSCNWGHHAREASNLCLEVMNFLNCKAKVQASSQALMNIRHYLSFSENPKTTGLHLAAYFGIEGAIEALLQKKVEIDATNTDGHLKKHTDLESKDEYGQTPLSQAAGNGHEAVVKLLLDKDANLESKDEYGRTPLSQAAENGHEAVVKLLLDKDANLDSKDRIGRSPLSQAAENGHEAVVKLLSRLDMVGHKAA